MRATLKNREWPRDEAIFIARCNKSIIILVAITVIWLIHLMRRRILLIGSAVDMVTVDVLSGHYMELSRHIMEVLEGLGGEWVPVDSDSRSNILGGFQHGDQGRLLNVHSCDLAG